MLFSLWYSQASSWVNMVKFLKLVVFFVPYTKLWGVLRVWTDTNQAKY